MLNYLKNATKSIISNLNKPVCEVAVMLPSTVKTISRNSRQSASSLCVLGCTRVNSTLDYSKRHLVDIISSLPNELICDYNMKAFCCHQE